MKTMIESVVSFGTDIDQEGRNVIRRPYSMGLGVLFLTRPPPLSPSRPARRHQLERVSRCLKLQSIEMFI